MKRVVSLFLVCILMVGMMFSLASCKKNPIPEGTYVYKDELFPGVAWDTKVIIKENNYYQEVFDNDQSGYQVYAVYTYELNKDKTEITLIFIGFKYFGNIEGAGMVQIYEQDYANGVTSTLYPEKNKPITHDFELGKGYFVLDENKFDLTDE